MRVIVIGGGAVGLCTAEALASRGAEVTVFERGGCGAGASAGNAGWITPSLSTPIPAPGVIGTSLRWLVNPQGPLWIRPTLSPAMLSWIAQFVMRCSGPHYRRGLSALQRAAARAIGAFDRLASRGVKFELHDEPLLYPSFSQPELDHLLLAVEGLHRAGSSQRIERLSQPEILELEPALDPSVIGGLIARGERRVRPELLTAGVCDALAERGAEVLERAPVVSLARHGSGWRAEGPGGTRTAEAVVIAAGVESRRLLRALGVGLPIVPAKGYSRTFSVDPTGPKRPLYLEDPKIAISVYDGGVRVSGTLELGARDLALSQRRLRAITAAAQRALPKWRMPPSSRDWAGMRSLSPDGLPYVGMIPGLDGIHVATAHATLGITLAPLTGELIASQLLDRQSDELLSAFDPARATRRSNGSPSTHSAPPGAGAAGQRQQEDPK